MRKHLVRIAVAAVAAGAMTAVAAPAQAAGGCSGAGPVKPGPFGGSFQTTYCFAYRSGNVFAENNNPSVGKLFRGRSWFVCQSKGSENPPVGQARNNWWLWTQADRAFDGKGYGWFPATHISGGANYEQIPGLPWCKTSSPGRAQ